MEQLKTKVINDIIKVEAGYVDDPSDSGGETCWGITVKVARAFGYTGPMKDLPKPVAFAIYVQRYWDKLNLDAVVHLSESIAEELADTGVNQGVARAGKFLQRSLNALNQRGDMYPDLVVDGAVGPASVKALTVYLKRRGKQGERVMLRALNSLQGAFYIELAERREKDERFVFGWLLNRVD